MSERRFAVKVCGLTDRQNIEDVCSLSPDYCGLIFAEKSPRFVSASRILPETSQEKFVGVFVDAEPETILEHIQVFDLSTVQLHGNEPRSVIEELKMQSPETEIWKVLHVGESFPSSLVKEYEETVDSFLFDTYSEQGGGSGQKFRHELLDQYEGSVPYLLSGGIGPEDVHAVRALFESDRRMRGVDVNSRFELAPGVKNVSLLSDFIKALRQ